MAPMAAAGTHAAKFRHALNNSFRPAWEVLDTRAFQNRRLEHGLCVARVETNWRDINARE
jgi:hypothetical protein